jgi:hypothetical protein
MKQPCRFIPCCLYGRSMTGESGEEWKAQNGLAGGHLSGTFRRTCTKVSGADEGAGAA